MLKNKKWKNNKKLTVNTGQVMLVEKSIITYPLFSWQIGGKTSFFFAESTALLT